MRRTNVNDMRVGRAILCAGAALSILLAGCTTSRSVAPPRQYDLPVQEHTLNLPEHFEVVSIDYDIEYATQAATAASGGFLRTGWLEFWSDACAFVKVHAFDPTTGDEYLLIYLDSTDRSEPLQVIRFERRPSPDPLPTEVAPGDHVVEDWQ